MSKYGKKKKKGQHRSLFRRKYDYGKGKCAYCLEYTPYSQITKDHVIPRSRGGSLLIENVVPCCFKCNQIKADQLGWIPKIDYLPFEQLLEEERKMWRSRGGKTLQEILNPVVDISVVPAV